MILPDFVDDLFKYNLQKVAVKFGLLEDDHSTLPIKTFTQALNYAEDLSFSVTDEERILSLIICALAWENRQPEWPAIKPFIARILIRLGLGTSAKMVNWNREMALFNSLGSIIDELSSTTKLVTYQVSINNKKIILSDFQKRMWDAITDSARLGISAPTSAGKSFVLINKTLEILSNHNGKVIFIVPTISLITQVCNDFRRQIKFFGLTDIYVSQTVNDLLLFKNEKIIYVLTQERASSALNHPDADFENIKLLVVDEIQNIEKVANESDERAQTLLDVIQTFKNDLDPEKIILSGPRLEKLNELVSKWFGENGKSVSEFLPSVLNVTYSFLPKRNKLLFKQYITPSIEHTLQIEDKFSLKTDILSRVRYSEKAYDFIAHLISRTESDGNIVFSDSTKNANEIAIAVASKITKEVTSEKIKSVKEFIESTVHPKYSLINTIDKGIAYHHSKMPPHIRCLVEKLFTLRHLSTVVATTTLMQGVNLPAKNIIIRNPKVGDEQLSGYEFSNLKGRAGRLMQDFVGRALVIDEKKCNDASIDLKVSDHKTLNLGYGTRYQDNKILIDGSLELNEEASLENSNDLVTYIRSMCIRYDKDALNRLREVGVLIAKDLFDLTLENIKNLSIPRRIALSNPYWDPLVLDRLYTGFSNGLWPQIPGNINDSGPALVKLLSKMYTEAPFYYKRYLGNIDPETDHGFKKITSLSIYAEQYGRGRPLRDVINPINFPISNSSDIEARINDIHTKVVFGIPKLLKPIFNIHDYVKDKVASQLLSFIEVGAVDQKLRALIEIGVPRETAISLLQRNTTYNFLDADNKVNQTILKDFIQDAKMDPHLNEWHKLLIDEL